MCLRGVARNRAVITFPAYSISKSVVNATAQAAQVVRQAPPTKCTIDPGKRSLTPRAQRSPRKSKTLSFSQGHPNGEGWGTLGCGFLGVLGEFGVSQLRFSG